MSDHVPRVTFYWHYNNHLGAKYWCPDCNGHEDITELASHLAMYGVHKCPENLYQAWKILCLGTDEYCQGGYHKEHRIILNAIEALKVSVEG